MDGGIKMKILVVPDIHGSWLNAITFIEKNKDKVDKVITLGDYVDDWDEDVNGPVMIEGFNKLCSMARAEPDKFCICIGNHDNSYISETREGSNCSGHHWEYAEQYEKMFKDNMDIINVAYLLDGILFSHAGVSQRWYIQNIGYYNNIHKFDRVPKKIMKEYLHWNDVSRDINKYYFDDMTFSLVNPETEEDKQRVKDYFKYQNDAHKKAADLYSLMDKKYGFNKIRSYNFKVEVLNMMFHEKYSYLDHCGWNSAGDSPGESPTWIRPDSLLHDNWPSGIRCQVVGHTELGLRFFKFGHHKLIVCDNHEHDCGFILDTEKLDELPFEKLQKPKPRKYSEKEKLLLAMLGYPC